MQRQQLFTARARVARRRDGVDPRVVAQCV
jgi:hypothetical protein